MFVSGFEASLCTKLSAVILWTLMMFFGNSMCRKMKIVTPLGHVLIRILKWNCDLLKMAAKII